MLPLDRTAALAKIIGVTMQRAIDLGNYSAVPTPEQVQCLKDQGYTRAIVGTSYGTVWAEQIASFEFEGMDVEVYQFPGRLTLSSRTWWLDCETPESTVDIIRGYCRTALPPTGIYTRRGWWVDNTGDWNIKAEFPWLKLWDASYGDPPPAFVPYGGFTSRAMHQWHNSTDLCGLNVDLNIIEEEHMPTAEYENLHETDDAIKAQLLSTAIDIGRKLDAFKTALGALAQANAGSFKAIEDRLTQLEGK